MSATPHFDSKHDAACRYIRWPFWLRGLRRWDTARCERCRKLKGIGRMGVRDESATRQLCVEAGGISGIVVGVGLGIAPYANPYITVSCVLGGVILFFVARIASR